LSATSSASLPPVVNSTRPALARQVAKRSTGARPAATARSGRKAPRREAQGVELRLDGADDVRVAMADVVHVVAVEVHVAPPGQVLDEQALGLGDGRQAGRRHRLVQEGRTVARQQRAAGSSRCSRCQAARSGVPLTSLSLCDGSVPGLMACISP
jgi:hypothetical protein